MTSPIAALDEPAASDARSSPRALDLDAHIPAQLTNLAQKITAGASARYRPSFGVGITDWRIMAMLASQPWAYAGRISEATGLDKAAVSRSLHALELDGLVETRRDSTDPRRRAIALTARGVVMHDRIVRLSRAREEALLDGFSDEERRQLADFLRRLARTVGPANRLQESSLEPIDTQD